MSGPQQHVTVTESGSGGATVTIEGEHDTLGNLLCSYARVVPDVEYVAYDTEQGPTRALRIEIRTAPLGAAPDGCLLAAIAAADADLAAIEHAVLREASLARAV